MFKLRLGFLYLVVCLFAIGCTSVSKDDASLRKPKTTQGAFLIRSVVDEPKTKSETTQGSFLFGAI